MSLDIYEQQEVTTGAKQITSWVVDQTGRCLFCLLVLSHMDEVSSCPVGVYVCSFARVCIVHPSPQLETTTSCVVVGDNGNKTRLPPELTDPTSASWMFTCYAARPTKQTQVIVMIMLWEIRKQEDGGNMKSIWTRYLEYSSVCYGN